MSGRKTYKKLEFSAIEDEFLIDNVRKNPPLYTKKLQSYKDLQIKDNIWKEIAAKMEGNKTGEDCKKRWANLRDYYMRKRKSLGTGSAARSDHRKMEQLVFLEDTAFEHRVTISNIAAPLTDSCSIESNDTVDLISCHDELPPAGTTDDNSRNFESSPTDDSIDDNACHAEMPPTVSAVGSGQNSSAPKKSRMTKNTRSELLQEIQKSRADRMQLLREIANRPPAPTMVREDHIDLFFKSLAGTARTLSHLNLIEAKKKLFNVMAEIEEKNALEESIWPPPSSSSPATLALDSPQDSDIQI